MPWQRKDPSEYRDCIICGEQFSRAERGYGAKTCSVDCAGVRQKHNCKSWAQAHPDEISAAVELYRKRNAEAARGRKAKRRARLRGQSVGRPRIYTDEEMRERRKMHRANWAAKNPERNAEAKRRWFEKNPGYRTQWARDKRAKRRDDQRGVEMDRM